MIDLRTFARETSTIQIFFILWPVFEPAQLPQETICPSVAFAKGQIGNSRGQSIINRLSPWRPPVYKMDTVFGESKLA